MEESKLLKVSLLKRGLEHNNPHDNVAIYLKTLFQSETEREAIYIKMISSINVNSFL